MATSALERSILQMHIECPAETKRMWLLWWLHVLVGVVVAVAVVVVVVVVVNVVIGVVVATATATATTFNTVLRHTAGAQYAAIYSHVACLTTSISIFSVGHALVRESAVFHVGGREVSARRLHD